MKPDRYRRIKEIVLAARRLPPDERESYLARACAGDPGLRAEVESLLGQEDSAPSILRTGGPAARAGVDPGAAPPETIGPYRILGVLGEGGMGVVYRALQTEPIRREVALKVIRLGMDTAGVTARFESERQALALLDHPGIARVLDAGSDERGRPYFVMELVDGVPITEYADAHRLSLRARLDLFLMVCRAVEHAHQRGILHRDLKPGNVLVTEQDGMPVPKIIDFGIAKALEEPLTGRSLFTEAGQLVGTPEYMSPEQAGLRPGGTDTRSDVYSLGVLLYELLTGRRPYRIERHALAEVQRVIAEEEPEKPSTAITRSGGDPSGAGTPSEARGATVDRLRRQLAGDLDVIVLMSLRKEPERRYSSVERFADDVRRHLDGLPVHARKDTWTYRTGKFVRRHRVETAAGVLAAGLLVAFAITMAATSARVARERDRALAAEARATTEARTTARVSDFMVSMFDLADPLQNQGDTLTARQLLDRGADRVRTELTGEPAVEAGLMNTMSKAYNGLRVLDRALALARDAVAIDDSLYGPRSPQVATGLTAMGAAYAGMGEYDRADSCYRASLALRRELLGPENPAVLETSRMLALNLQTTAHNAEAESLYQAVYDVERKTKGPDDPDVLDALNNLAGIFYENDKVPEAEAGLREVIDRLKRTGAHRPVLLADAEAMLAVSLKNRGKLADAEPYYRESLEIRERVLGNHTITAESLNNFGVFLRSEGKAAEAVTYLRRAAEMNRGLLGEKTWEYANATSNLARALQELGRDREAEESYRRAILSMDESPNPDFWVAGKFRQNYGEMLAGQKRYREAEPLLLRAYRLIADGLGRDHRRALEAAKSLVDLYTAWGKPAKAAEYRPLAAPADSTAADTTR